ncbi:MAG: trypsin-like peptidase domain-containing protein [Gemmatimonadota bacterium]
MNTASSKPALATALLAAALLGLAAALASAADGGARPDAGRASLSDLSRAFRAVYEQVAPAVVQVNTVGHGRSPNLRRSLPPRHPPIEPFDEDIAGLGSGIIVRADGYILSNYHVIEGADSIYVTLADRRTAPAQVVGFDSLIDIAVLKVDAGPLPTARIGDSTQLQIGDWVLAIGFPLGLGTTLTHGIVSALGRQVGLSESVYGIESFIQTNAVINPGNSGGPLLNLDGEVIGVNTAISTRTGYYMGYGLAVPIELAREALRDVLEHGRVVRGYLGVNMREVDEALIAERGLALASPRGVLIDPVDAHSPAARSGLRSGDILLAVEGQPVDHPNQVQTLIYGRDPGEPVALRILRDGAELTVAVTLGEREDDRLLAEGRRRLTELGLEVAPLTAALAAELGFTAAVAGELGLDGSAGGAVITGLDADGPAVARGLGVHDIVTEVDTFRVGSPEDLVRSIARLERGRAALFWVWRPGRGVDVRFLQLEGDS